MIIVATLTALLLTLAYLLIGLVIAACRLWRCGYEIRDANDLIEFLIIAGTSAILWPVLAWIWWNEDDDQP